MTVRISQQTVANVSIAEYVDSSHPESAFLGPTGRYTNSMRMTTLVRMVTACPAAAARQLRSWLRVTDIRQALSRERNRNIAGESAGHGTVSRAR